MGAIRILPFSRALAWEKVAEGRMRVLSGFRYIAIEFPKISSQTAISSSYNALLALLYGRLRGGNMFDEDFLHSLPDDPDEALAKLFANLTSVLDEQRIEASEHRDSSFVLIEWQRSLLIKVFAFIAAHNIDLPLNREPPTNYEEFEFYYRQVISDIEYHIAKTSFERVARNKSGISAVYVLPAALKLEIHHYLKSVREIIAKAELTDLKRTALTNKLNAFASEVDRDKTRIEALASAIIWTRKELINGAQGLEPIVEKLDKMFQSMAKATEFARLPSPDKKKQISGPPKRIEGPKQELDDEVPF
jgi:hypothetical protein